MIEKEDMEMYQSYGIFTNPILNKYMRYYNKQILNQHHMSILSFFQMCGCIAMFNNIMIRFGREKFDLRLPMIWFSDSSSGKGMTIGIQNEFLKELNINCQNVKNPSPERLVGSFNETIQKRNLEKNIKKDNPKYVSPEIPGLLKNNFLLFFDEVDWLFEEKNLKSQLILRTLRFASDKYASEGNWISAETLKSAIEKSNTGFFSPSTFTLTSYPLKKASEQLSNNGIFQRCITVFIRQTNEQIEEALKYIIPPDVVVTLDNLKLDITNKLKELKQKNIKMSIKNIDDFNEFIKLFIRRMRMMLKDAGIENKKLRSFFMRGRNNAIKIAGINAFISKRDYIIKEDLLTGLELTLQSLETVKNEIIEHTKKTTTKEMYGIIRYVFDKETWYSKTQICEMLPKYGKSIGWDLGINKTFEMFDDLKIFFMEKEDYIKNTKKVKLYKLKRM